SPTPPQPNTATIDPGATRAVFNAAPTPVVTPQPIKAARSNGRSSRTRTMALLCTSIFSAYADKLANWLTVEPFHRSLGAASLGPPGRVDHRCVLPVRQYSHWPQNTDKQPMTWSPGLNSVTRGPTSSTTPAASWPRMAGDGKS